MAKNGKNYSKELKDEKIYRYRKETASQICEPIAEYCRMTRPLFQQLPLFSNEVVESKCGDIKVVELFAGVGGFRIGLERASKRYKTVWNNQWEPSTKKQERLHHIL